MVAESSGLVIMWSHTLINGYISRIILDPYSIASWSFHVTTKWNSCCLVGSHHCDMISISRPENYPGLESILAPAMVLVMMDRMINLSKVVIPCQTWQSSRLSDGLFSAWNLDLAEDTIQNCLKKAFSTENMREVNCQAVIIEITCGIQQLQVSNHIQNAMDIHQFLIQKKSRLTIA